MARTSRRPQRLLTAVLVVLVGAVGCASRGGPGQATGSSDPASSVSSGPAACGQSGVKSTVAYRTVEGVDPDLTSADVYPVAGVCDAPVVMWVHGGGYRIGDKANQIRDKAKLLNDNGWVLVSVNYRLTDPGQPGSAQYPDHFDDAAAAVAWVEANIGSYGGDPSRVALLGHSAGADIVSNVATNPAYLHRQGLELSALRCAGPLDTEGFDKVAAGADDPDGEQEQWRSALGNNPNYLTETSATMLVAPGIGIPPMIGVVRGIPRRQQIETAFLAALRSAGIENTSIDARALTHNEVNTSIGAPGDTVMTAPVVAFLEQCFR